METLSYLRLLFPDNICVHTTIVYCFTRPTSKGIILDCVHPKGGMRKRLRGWLGPGGLPGLQNRWRVALRAAVGSTPIHSRLFLIIIQVVIDI